MKLYVTSRYTNGARGLVFQEGQEIDVAESLADFLLGDSPGSFSRSKPKKASSKPPADKAVKEPEDKPASKSGTRKK